MVTTISAPVANGVSGTATLVDAGGGQTKVVIKGEDNLKLDMQTVIAPGTCVPFTETTNITINDTRSGESTSVVLERGLCRRRPVPHGQACAGPTTRTDA